MNSSNRSRITLAAASTLVLAATLAAPQGTVAQQRPSQEARQTAGERVDAHSMAPRRPAAARRLTGARAGHMIRLGPMQARATGLANDGPSQIGPVWSGPVQIGTGRDIPAAEAGIRGADLTWHPVDGGRATNISIVSPGARALRVGLVAEALPDGAELRFLPAGANMGGFGPYDRDRLQRTRGARLRSTLEPFWSPVISGNAVDIEIWLPSSAAPSAVRLRLPLLSHIDVDPRAEQRDLSHIGRSSACEVDLACDPKWQTAADSVAKMVFTTFGGGTALCTGQLLADTDESHALDYFLTANHCIGLQQHADTIDFFWFFQRTACGSGDPAAVVQTTGGAQILLARRRGNSTDQTLMLLNEPAPIGATRTGWSTREPDKEDDIVRGIHHPNGDLKKLSVGLVKLLAAEGTQDFPSHVWIEWSSGVTEPGSSGSGIWFDGEWPNQFLIGTLTSGASSCANPTAIDKYGRFDQIYAALEAWLDPGAMPVIASGAETRDSVQEDKWKVYRLQPDGAAADVDAIARDITGNVDLFLLATLAPAGTLFDCASRNPGSAQEECSVARSPGTTFVGVFGAAAGRSDFTLVADAVTVPFKKPKKPKMKTAKRLSAGKVRVTWSDRSKDEAGFTLERKVGKGKWETIATLPPNSRTTIDSGLQEGVKTCYRARAFNVVGASAASNKRCVRP